jgi:hypothetical protein
LLFPQRAFQLHNFLHSVNTVDTRKLIKDLVKLIDLGGFLRRLSLRVRQDDLRR